MPNMYEFEEFDGPKPSQKSLRLHEFEYQPENRHMICKVCKGRMNYCDAYCPGREPQPPIDW